VSLLVLLLVLAFVWTATARVVLPSIHRLREQQIREGLFGARERERLIVRSAGELVAVAEREVRLGHFGSELRSRAWEGALVDIAHPSLRRSSTWRFPDGARWTVDLANLPPRDAPRVVIRSLGDPCGSALRVSAYVPGRRDVTLLVTDAQPLRLS
jgi:hypothetical protein